MFYCSHDWYINITLLQTFHSQVQPGLTSLSQRILGPNTLVQGALPKILESTPQEFFDSTIEVVKVRTVIDVLWLYNACARARAHTHILLIWFIINYK